MSELSARPNAIRPRIAARSAAAAPARTREKILNAAESLFAERGFRGTSIRRITTLAGCNLAAVNYHFGGKAGLYREMFRRRLEAVREQRLGEVRRTLDTARPRPGLEDLLRAFTTAFLATHRDQNGDHRLMLLFSRELLDPHLPPGLLRRELVKPMNDGLVAAIRSIGYEVDGPAGRRSIESLIAQLVHIVRMRAAHLGTGPGGRGDDLRGVIDHIVRFSTAGMRACVNTRVRR
jgi:AcrR family transcriptional regulator